MGLLAWLFGGTPRDDDDVAPDRHAQAVILRLRLSDENLGTKAEFDRYEQLMSQIATALAEDALGEVKCDEAGDGFYTINCAGPKADDMWEAMKDLIEKQPLPKGSKAILRYGPMGRAPEDEINLHWDG